MDGREDVIRGPGPAERFGIGVDGGDVGLDGLLQLLRRAMDTAPDLPRGEVGKEALDLIDPSMARRPLIRSLQGTRPAGRGGDAPVGVR